MAFVGSARYAWRVSTARALAPATYDDVLRAPPDKLTELIGGELHVSPRPAPPHALVSSRLGEALAPFNRGRGGSGGPGGWVILDEPELHLGGDALVPDVAGWRQERMPAMPEEAFFALAPDWVCEVASDGTRRLDRGGKMQAYARERVQSLWLIEPLSQMLEVYRLENGLWLRIAAHAGDVGVRAEPFAEVEIDLDRLWNLWAP